MRPRTAELWARQDRHPGDRCRLFHAVAQAVDAATVLYPGSYCDLAASFVWSSVTYVDIDRRAALFFDDAGGVREIIASHDDAPDDPVVRFVQADFTGPLPLDPGSFDLVVSLYAGPISRYCTDYLRVGGALLVNPSHGDAALASIDPRYTFAGVVRSRAGDYTLSSEQLDTYLIPKKPIEVTAELIERTGRGVAYTRSPFAYLFRRTA